MQLQLRSKNQTTMDETRKNLPTLNQALFENYLREV